MNYSDYRFTLDVQLQQAQVSVPATYGDTARKLYIGLTDGRKPYAVEKGCTAVLTARKPNGAVDKNYCVIENNTLVYEFTTNTTNCAGIVRCDITIRDAAGKALTSPKFVIVVEKNVENDGGSPGDEGGGNITTVGQATPTIAVSESGLISATVDQMGGLVEGGKKTATFQLDTQAADTITPTKSPQTAVAKGYYTTGAVTVAPIPANYIDSENIEIIERATPVITVSDEGLITAKVEQAGGFVEEGTESETVQLPIHAAETIIPSKGDPQTAVAKGYYTTGDVVVDPIPDEYIVPSGTLFITSNGVFPAKNYSNVEVSVPINGLDTSDATATEATIVSPYTAYVNGKKIEGKIQMQAAADVFIRNDYAYIRDGYYPDDTRLSNTKFVPEIIKKGVSIFGIVGTYEGSVNEASLHTALDNLLAAQEPYLSKTFTFIENYSSESRKEYVLNFYEGETWAEWCATANNTVGLKINEEFGELYHNVSAVVDLANRTEALTGSTVIEADHTYGC